MSGPIEEAAKTWLIEPAYQKVKLKHVDTKSLKLN